MTHLHDFGGSKLAIRTNSEDFARWLDEAFGAFRIDEKPEYQNFSVFIAEQERPGKRFHVLYGGTRVVVRSRRLETIARALVAQVELFLLPRRDDAIYGEMTVLAANGTIALVPPLMLPLLEVFSKREIERAGLVLPIGTTVAIDPSSGDLMPLPRVLDLAEGVIEQLAALDSDQDELRVTVDRPMTPDVVVSFGSEIKGGFGPVSKAQALYRAASHSLNLRKIGGEVGLAGLRRTVDRADCFELGINEWKKVPQALAAIFRP